MSNTDSETTQLLSSEGGASNYNTAATQGQGEEVHQGQETVENIFSVFALGGACVCLAVLDGGHYCAGLFETSLIRNTDITSMWIKIGGSLEIGLSSVVSPFAFWAIKKSGRGFVALFGTGVACAGWLLVSFAENEVVFLSAKALLGGGFGMMYIASVSAVNVAFDRHRSKALALGCTFSAVGQVVMSGLASYLLGSGGLGYALRWMSATCGIVGVVGAVLFRQIDRNQGTNRHGVEQQISIESGEETTGSESGDLDEEPGSTVEVIEDGEDIAVGVEGDFEEKKIITLNSSLRCRVETRQGEGC